MAFRGDIRDRVGLWISQGRRGKGSLGTGGLLALMGVAKIDWAGAGRRGWRREELKGRTVYLGRRPASLITEIVEVGIGTYQVSLIWQIWRVLPPEVPRLRLVE